MNLSPFCVYTIIHVDELKRVHRDGGAGSFTENKRWVTGAQLLKEAQVAGQRMAVIFADAATTAELLYYAWLTEIELLDDDSRGPTRYSFEDLTPIHPSLPKSTLLLKSSGQPLNDNYIRPYVICHTPNFLTNAAPTPAKGKVARLIKRVLPSRVRPVSPTLIYLFGYTGKTMTQIERAIGENGLLLDIRYSPRSRKAGFSRSGLERVFGERYRHVRELGNAGYQTGELELADADAGLTLVEGLAAEHGGPIFLMCACGDGSYCHRSEVGRLLRKRGYRVEEYAFDAD